MEGHAPDCACCVVRINKRQRTGAPADLSTFLPLGEPPADDEPVEEGGEEEGEEEEADAQSIDRLISKTLFTKFEKHVRAIEQARAARQELLSFKSALEDEGGRAEVSADATLDERDALGVWLPGDIMQGDVNMRTLQKLLTRVDQRGFERSSQQLEFHEAFLKAAARIIFKGDWETRRPEIMRRHGWETSNSEVLIRCVRTPRPSVTRFSHTLSSARSTPRRFGKTFRCLRRPLCPLACVFIPSRVPGSIAIFCACLALAFGLEIGAPRGT